MKNSRTVVHPKPALDSPHGSLKALCFVELQSPRCVYTGIVRSIKDTGISQVNGHLLFNIGNSVVILFIEKVEK